jgi:hypothetical protein
MKSTVNCFSEGVHTVDTKSSGILSIKHPLRSLGLVQTHDEIREILKKIEPDQSELINFEDFPYTCNIIKYYKSAHSLNRRIAQPEGKERLRLMLMYVTIKLLCEKIRSFNIVLF